MDVDSPLKRCSSAPIIANRLSNGINNSTSSSTEGTTISGSALERPSGTAITVEEDRAMASQSAAGPMISETPAAPNIFSRTRRYSASSFSPLAVSSLSSSSTASSSSNGAGSPSPATTSASGLRLTPRVSQLRQEECADQANMREANHERGLHSQLQISQSWEDLTIVTENWSCRDDLTLTNPLLNNCSSPSPTSSRHGSTYHPHPSAAAAQLANSSSNSSFSSTLRYPFGMSPSPTRKTFATRRSMSPNHVRPSQLCPVKRKFDMDDNCGGGSPPPHKKMFLDVVTRGSSPIHSLPAICASPDSGTYEGRTTPKLYISKLCSSNSLSSFSSASASPTSQLEMNDGPSTGVGGEGTKSKGNNNIIINNLVGSRSSSGSNSSAAADAKEEEDGSNGAGDDHQMLDLSMGRREGEDEVASAAAQGNCDKLTETPAKGKSMEHEVAEIKKDPNEAEVDDGIGEEVGREKAVLLQDLEKCEEGTVM